MNTTTHPAAASGSRPSGRLDFDRRPILVFWETTRACLLACRHCRAEALDHPMPGQLSGSEGRAFIDTLAGFGTPPPVLILTGGDVMMRDDVFDMVDYARSAGIPVGLSPSVTPMLTEAKARHMRELGVKAASISLDGASAATHENIRGVAGHFSRTLDAMRMMVGLGYSLQVNTTVMRSNVEELADIAGLLSSTGVRIWEVFFLVTMGRGTDLEPIDPREHEDVAHFLYDVSRRGIQVRTVEAPFFRRVTAWREEQRDATDVAGRFDLSPLYRRLSTRVEELLGAPGPTALARTANTRDGKGIIFVGHDGEIHPAGFLPLSLGNVRRTSIVDIYRDHPLLRSIRAGEFTGRCGRCPYADLCGGSRARAYATSGDPLGEDTACPYVPMRAD